MLTADEAEAARQEAIAIRHQVALLKQELLATGQELTAARAQAGRLNEELEEMRATRAWRSLERARLFWRRLPGRSAD